MGIPTFIPLKCRITGYTDVPIIQSISRYAWFDRDALLT